MTLEIVLDVRFGYGANLPWILEDKALVTMIAGPASASFDAPGLESNVPPPSDTDGSPEATRIRRSLQRAGGHRERAAHMLGMSRVTLWRLMRGLGLDVLS